LRAAFESLAREPLVARIAVATRVLGAVAAIELRGGATLAKAVRPVETEADLSSAYASQIGWRVYDEALTRGAYLRPLGNVVYLAPALNIELSELDRLLAILVDSVRAVAREA